MEKDFKFGTKNNWRKQVWNEIASRTSNRPNAIVIYMPGRQDLDRKIATQKGFKADNFIGIDNNRDIVKALRKEGKLLICGDFFRIIQSWPNENPEVSVISADLCHGFEPINTAIWPILLTKKSFYHAVVAMTFQRGRDPRINHIREAMEIFDLGIECKKHRGYLFIFSFAMGISLQAIHRRGQVPVDLTIREKKAMLGEVISFFTPKFFSYRSGSLIMDSVVFKASAVPVPDGAPPRAPMDENGEELKLGDVEHANKVRAALAIRTMRREGTLPHQPSL